MRRIAKWLAIAVICVWAAGCFSGGEIVDEQTDTGALERDAGDCPDGGSACASQCTEGEAMCGSQCIEASLVPDGGCEAGCEPSNGGVEICDGIDNDCDGIVDNGFDTGPCTVGTGACEATGTFVCVDEQTSECDAEPGESEDEICDDGIDNDCDGEVDEDDAVDALEWHADQDGDGYGNPDEVVTRCSKPSEYVEQGGDCDDQNAQVNPSAEEVCDGIDNDCDGGVDDASAVDVLTWYIDCDGDGFAADSSGARDGCEEPAPPPGCSHPDAAWTQQRPGDSSTDCNDDVADAYPGQNSYFDNPMSGGDFNERWDYDCDGFVDHRWEDTGGHCDSSCSGQAGWIEDFSPSCGQSDDYITCTTPIGQCSSSPVARTQTCR